MKRYIAAAIIAATAMIGSAQASNCMMMKANLDVQMNMTFSSLDAFGAEVKMESRANKLLLKFHNEQIERHARQALNTLNSIKNVKGMCGVKKENIEKTINSTANLIEKSVEYSNIINN